MFDVIGFLVFLVLGAYLLFSGVASIWAISALGGKFDWPCLIFIVGGILILFLAFESAPFTLSISI